MSILVTAALPEFPFLLNFSEQPAQFLHGTAVPPFNADHSSVPYRLHDPAADVDPKSIGNDEPCRYARLSNDSSTRGSSADATGALKSHP